MELKAALGTIWEREKAQTQCPTEGEEASQNLLGMEEAIMEEWEGITH